MRSVVPTVHNLERPWTEKYWRENPIRKFPFSPVVPVVQPIREEDWMWFRGDRVEILTGPDKGKQGYINMIVQVSLSKIILHVTPLFLCSSGKKLGDSRGLEC